MYFLIITSFFDERGPFSKLEAQANSKNKPKFLNITFLDTFCICSRENGGGNGVCALIHPIFHTFDRADTKN